VHYPIAIKEGNDDTASSIVVPDLPGCFSAADSGIDEALSNAREAMLLWI
jgi:predicted RNase H-like HicB family nuclease